MRTLMREPGKQQTFDTTFHLDALSPYTGQQDKKEPGKQHIILFLFLPLSIGPPLHTTPLVTYTGKEKNPIRRRIR